MNNTSEQQGQEQTNKFEDSIIMNIGNEPVMQSAVDVLTAFGNKSQIILKAKGNSIPNAVAVANIITEKMLNNKTRIQKIILDTDGAAGIGRMTSTVEIILNKI